MKRTPDRALLLALFALALALRLWGIGFSLPYTYHPDEPAHVLQALAVARVLPNGLTFANPPLYKYVLVSEYVATYGVGRLLGVYGSPEAFISQFRADPTLLHLLARGTSAFLGALAVFATYALGSALCGRRAGLLAAWLTAVAYALVRESHFGVNDALVTLLVTRALFFCVRAVQRGRQSDYVAAGMLTGLAFAAKYHALALLVPLLLAHTLSPRRRPRDLLLALGVGTMVALVAFPSLVLEPRRVLHDVYIHLYVKGQVGYDGTDPAGGYVYYLKALVWGLGWPLVVVSSAGLLLAIVLRDRALLVVAALPLALYLFMGYQRMFFARFLLPAVPALLVLAAVAADRLASWLVRRFNRPLPTRLVLVGLALLLGTPTLLNSLRFDLILTREDTRTESRRWVEANLPAGSRVALDWFPYGPPLPAERYDLLVANGWSLADLTFEEYRQRGVEYLVVSSFSYDQPLLDPASDARRRAFYAALEQEAQLVREFRPYVGPELRFVYDQIYAPFNQLERVERPGPTVRVLRLPSQFSP